MIAQLVVNMNDECTTDFTGYELITIPALRQITCTKCSNWSWPCAMESWWYCYALIN
jgi:hypothetical protein